MAFEKDPHAHEGDSPAECAKKLVAAGADVVGINCLRNPEQTLSLIEEVVAAVDAPVATQPVAYRTPDDQPDFTSLPEFPFYLDPLQLDRREMADYAVKARDLGVRFIGACCGTVPSHIREMGRALGVVPLEDRPWTLDPEHPKSAFEYYGHQG
jgi:betaine-homocysteine S-methyltransferase